LSTCLSVAIVREKKKKNEFCSRDLCGERVSERGRGPSYQGGRGKEKRERHTIRLHLRTKTGSEREREELVILHPSFVILGGGGEKGKLRLRLFRRPVSTPGRKKKLSNGRGGKKRGPRGDLYLSATREKAPFYKEKARAEKGKKGGGRNLYFVVGGGGGGKGDLHIIRSTALNRERKRIDTWEGGGGG